MTGSLIEFFYRQRCRLGAWLLREHVAATLEHYEDVADFHNETRDRMREARCSYIAIGLKHAIRKPWRRFGETW